MSFFLNKSDNSREFISSSYLKNQLLGYNSSDDENILLESESEKTILQKLNITPIVKSSKDLVNSILINIGSSSNYLNHAVLSMERIHILALAYLLEDGLITNSEFLSILKSDSIFTRSDLILKFLSRSNDDKIDVITPLVYHIKTHTNRIENQDTPEDINLGNLNANLRNIDLLYILYSGVTKKLDVLMNDGSSILPNWTRDVNYDVWKDWTWLYVAIIDKLFTELDFSMSVMHSLSPFNPANMLTGGGNSLYFQSTFHRIDCVASHTAQTIVLHSTGPDKLTDDMITIDLERVNSLYKSYGYSYYLKYIFKNRFKLNFSDDDINELKKNLERIFLQVLSDEVHKKVTTLIESDTHDPKIYSITDAKLNDGKDINTLSLLITRNIYDDVTFVNKEVPIDGDFFNYYIVDIPTDSGDYFAKDISDLLNRDIELIKDSNINNEKVLSETFLYDSQNITNGYRNNIRLKSQDNNLRNDLLRTTLLIDDNRLITDFSNSGIANDINNLTKYISKISSKDIFSLDMTDSDIEIKAWLSERKETVTNALFEKVILESGPTFKLRRNEIDASSEISKWSSFRLMLIYEILIDYLDYLIDDSCEVFEPKISETLMKWYKTMYMLRISIYTESANRLGSFEEMDSFASLSDISAIYYDALYTSDLILKEMNSSQLEFLESAEAFYLDPTIEKYLKLQIDKRSSNSDAKKNNVIDTIKSIFKLGD